MLITILTIVPSVLIGAYKVYETVMKQNLSGYLDNSFTFNDTKVVQSQIDVINREVSLSLVGTQLSDDVISVLEKTSVITDWKTTSLISRRTKPLPPTIPIR